MIKLCVLGPSGRMGALVVELAGARPDMRVVSAVDRADSGILGTEIAPGVLVTSDLRAGLGKADVYIDFTTPAATRAAAGCAAALGVAGIIGTTGLGERDHAALSALGESTPVLFAPNFSLGVNVLLGLAEQAARALGPGFDLEVVELHHKHKRDAPSGTALALADALAAGRGTESTRRLSREGETGPRSAGEIGVVAVRGGDVAGEHTAYFLGPNERLEITHRAGSRRIFAAGAVHAAAWIAGKPPGRYSMKDVLGL